MLELSFHFTGCAAHFHICTLDFFPRWCTLSLAGEFRLGRKASEKDSGDDIFDGYAGSRASHGAIAERLAGNGDDQHGFELSEIAPQHAS
jgi:hypothetical protein